MRTVISTAWMLAATLALGCAKPAASITDAPRRHTDRFGVAMLLPTKAGGREWYLPPSADAADDEWRPESTDVECVTDGIFHASGKVRLNVRSPPGQPWWRNVEMTAYVRLTDALTGGDQPPHWELYARGERHTEHPVTGASTDDGVAAPLGTRTWPGYPFDPGPLNPHCLGSAYKGNVYVSGRVHLEKEISHPGGYAQARSESQVTPWAEPTGRWLGIKFVLRNVGADSGVRLELWLDQEGHGTAWSRVAESIDAGGWSAPSLDGCDAPPFRYAPDQILAWAGPWVTFRGDATAFDFKWLSVREIEPLP